MRFQFDLVLHRGGNPGHQRPHRMGATARSTKTGFIDRSSLPTPITLISSTPRSTRDFISYSGKRDRPAPASRYAPAVTATPATMSAS